MYARLYSPTSPLVAIAGKYAAKVTVDLPVLSAASSVPAFSSKVKPPLSALSFTSSTQALTPRITKSLNTLTAAAAAQALDVRVKPILNALSLVASLPDLTVILPTPEAVRFGAVPSPTQAGWVSANEAWMVEGSLGIKDGVTAPTNETGRAYMYIDSADGDLKIIFADGTIKTIATNP